MEQQELFRTDANRRQTECNEACFDCRGAKEEKPEGLNDSRLYQQPEEDTSPKPLVFPLKDKDLPPIIREVVGNAPQNRKLPCFVACLSPLCALAPRVRLQYYYDGTRPSALLLQVIIEAPQSCGKQFAADIEKLLMDNTLKAQDQQQGRLEQDYREKKKRRKANEKLEEEPRTTIPQPSSFTPEKYMRFFERPFINQAAGEFLFENRHIDPRVVRWCRLTSWKNWLQIPFFDIDGNLTGVQWRNLAPSPFIPHLSPRFRFPYGSQCHIYNLPVLKLLKPGEELYIAEGCSDCWSLLSSGHKAIAIPSATLLKPKDLEILLSLSSSLSLSLRMYPDADLPGERLFLKLKDLLETPSPLTPHPSPLTLHP